nr:cytosine permease [Micrococcus sp. KRD153]
MLLVRQHVVQGDGVQAPGRERGARVSEHVVQTPPRGTVSTLRMLLIWLAANLVVTTLLTGTLFQPGVSYATALTSIVLGTVLGALVLVGVGVIGARTGLPTMALTRAAFGHRGSLLPVTFNVVVLMGWSWVQAMLAGLAVDALVSAATGFSSPMLFAVLCQLVVVALAILGHEGIARIEPWLALVMLAVMGGIFVTAFRAHGPAELASIPVDPTVGLTPALAFDLVFATAISWTVLSADITRNASTPRAAALGSGIGYTLSTVIAMSLGLTAFAHVLLGDAAATPFDPATLVTAFGWPLAVVMFLSVMATNTMVVYGMATSVTHASLSRPLPFVPVALVLGAVSVIGAMWFDLLTRFTDFLALIGAFFVPVFAVILVDYVLQGRRITLDVLVARGPRAWFRVGVHWRAVAVWAVGAATSWLLTDVWPSPVGATVPVFLLSALLYALLAWPRHRPEARPEAGASIEGRRGA